MVRFDRIKSRHMEKLSTWECEVHEEVKYMRK